MEVTREMVIDLLQLDESGEPARARAPPWKSSRVERQPLSRCDRDHATPRAGIRDSLFPSMRAIRVTHRTGAIYDVVVDDGRGTTTHEVTVWPSDVARYAPEATPEQLIESSFVFLLEREPKEAILRRFELSVIERYFPEYRALVARMIRD